MSDSSGQIPKPQPNPGKIYKNSEKPIVPRPRPNPAPPERKDK